MDTLGICWALTFTSTGRSSRSPARSFSRSLSAVLLPAAVAPASSEGVPAAGVEWDLRKAQPYCGYEKYDFDIPTCANGDTYDRYIVRMQEFRQSVRIIRQAVDSLPEGPIKGRVSKVFKPPVGEAYESIEAPKGELGYYVVSDGSTQPYRLRVRPPSFVNLQALDEMCRGCLVADVVAIIGTIDIVLGEVDR